MPNMANIISGHNKKVTGATDSLPEEGCNWRKGTDSCVLGGKCLTKNMVYKCQVTVMCGNSKTRKNPHTTMKRAAPYSKETQTCQLCLVEKTIISLADCNVSLNKRNEIVDKCRHRDKWLLKKL